MRFPKLPRSATFTACPYREREGAMQMNRRQLLLAGLAAPLMGARPAPELLLDRGFARVTRIAPGVFATIADFSKGPQCASNGGVIAGRDAVLIVEGHF